MDKSIIQLLENICNANAMVNTWLMWVERALPGQRTYSVSVYQQRDAFSHIVTMFTQGFSDGYLNVVEEQQDLIGFFTNLKVKEQLNSAYEHVTRAFFDCADFIYMELRDACKENPERYRFLSLCMNHFSKEVDALRSSKSEPANSTYQRIEQWNSLLCTLAAAYELGDFYAPFKNLINQAFAIITRIEMDYSRDLIMRCCPNFFTESIHIQNESNRFLTEFDKLFTKNGGLLPKTSSLSPSDVIDELAMKLKAKIEEFETHLAKYEGLYKSMKIHSYVENRKSIWSVVSKIVLVIVTPLAALVAGGVFQQLSKTGTNTTQTGISMNALWGGLTVFIIGQIVAYLIERKWK